MVKDAESAAKDEVWAGYRFVALADGGAETGLKVIDLGAGHSSSSESLCGRVLTALRTEALLSENVGAGYIDRHWPPAFKEEGAWPLTSLRQSFLNGSLTRLVDPDAALRRKIVEWVESGSFGLASGETKDGGFERIWYSQPVGAAEVAFEPSVFLLTKKRCENLRTPMVREPSPPPANEDESPAKPDADATPIPEKAEPENAAPVRLLVSGAVPPELWNRLGSKIIPKLRTGNNLTATVEFGMEIPANEADTLTADLKMALSELGLANSVSVNQD